MLPNICITSVSSASATTNVVSPFPRDSRLSQELLAAELVVATALKGNTRILRPSKIYGSGHDNSVAKITQILAQNHMFSLVGSGVGLRAPMHVDDLAQVAVAAVAANQISNPVYVLGGEQLTFREVVRRIAIAANIRYIEIPMTSFPFFLGARHLEILVASAALWQLVCACLKISQCQMMLRFLVFQEGCSIPML